MVLGLLKKGDVVLNVTNEFAAIRRKNGEVDIIPILKEGGSWQKGRHDMAAREREHCIAQKKGKERDLYTCQICGSRDHVEGHHILNYQYGGAASMDNIVTLCQKCHKQVYRGKIDILKI